ARCPAPSSSPRSRSTARRRRSAGRGSRSGRRRTARPGRAPRRARRAPGRPRTATARRPGRSPPWSVRRVVPAQRREVELAQRLLDEPLLVVLGERLAGHLLGRQHGEIGDLVTDLLDRAARLGLDVAPRLGQELLALDLCLLERL